MLYETGVGVHMKRMEGIVAWHRRIASDANKTAAGFRTAAKAAFGFAAVTAAVGVLLPMRAWAGTYTPSVYVTATQEGTKVAKSSSEEGTLDTGEIIITGTATSSPNIVITAEAGCTAKVTFKNLTASISKYGSGSPVTIKGEGDVVIELDGTNTLTGYYRGAGLEKSDEESSGTLTICDDNGVPGTLNATGGTYGAGIGGMGYWSDEGDSGNIIITGGTINATGGKRAAGIGGGQYGDGHDITITGGTVTAQGGYEPYTSSSGGYDGGAGIGGGPEGNGYNITISGGTVKAIAGYGGAGIGGGEKTFSSDPGGDGHDITISGGDVTAWGTATSDGSGAGIGGGEKGDAYNIYITGGTVDAKGSYWGGAGIGSGEYGRAYDIYISGGTVTARTSHSCAVAIGSDNDTYTGLTKKPGWGKIVISGGNVTTVSEYYGDNAIIGGDSYYVLSDYVEIKDDANVTLECRDYLSESATWITTCELHEGGKLEWKRPTGDKAVYKTIEGVAGSEHTWGDVVDEKYILSDAVCDQPSPYYKSCTKCGMKSSTLETFISEKAPGHLYKSITSSTKSWKYDDKTHYYECIRDKCPDRVGSHEEEAAHTIEEYVYYEGWYYANCMICYYTPGESYGYHEHTLDTMEKVEATAANCSKDGNIEYYKCPVTKKPFEYDSEKAAFVAVSEDDVIIKATGQHVLESDTYESDSENHWHTCSVCKQKVDVGIHSPSNCTPTEDKTKHTSECRICHSADSVKTEPHEYDEWKCDDDDTYHWKVCSKCGYADESAKEKHEFKDDKKCIDCGYDMITGHLLQLKDGKAATCTEDGYEDYYKCGTEGHENEVFVKNGIGAYILADERTTIDALGHKAGNEYKQLDDTYCAPVCIREKCGVTIVDEKEEHEFKDGKTCIRCGYTKGSGEHTHTYNDTVWTYNTTNHWHQCIAAGCPDESGSIKDKAAHTFDGRECTVCGYTKSSSGGSSNVNTGWIKDNKGWKFRNSDGTYAKGSTITDANGNKLEKVLWQKAGSSYFAFGSDSYLVTGWISDAESGRWYYCDENNGRQTGWLYSTADNHWYYLDPSTGEMLTGWQNIGGNSYYLAGEPAAPTYSFDAAAKKWIYNNELGYYPFGAMYANTVTPDNYQVDANGAWIH